MRRGRGERLRISRFVVLVGGEHVGHRGGELVDVPVGVDVAGRLDRGMAEQLLDGLEVAGGVEHALAGCVAALVHLLAAGRAGRDDAGGGKAAIPPVVRGVAAHRLLRVAAHAYAGDRALRAEQVVRGLGFDVEDVVFEVVLQRKRRLEQKVRSAHSLMRAEEDGRPTRVSIPTELRRAVFERDGGRCVECDGRFDLQYDHILPVAHGGGTTLQNLQLLCADCNRRKSDSI